MTITRTALQYGEELMEELDNGAVNPDRLRSRAVLILHVRSGVRDDHPHFKLEDEEQLGLYKAVARDVMKAWQGASFVPRTS